jgi:thioredoxin reductase (NADPH)
MVMYDVIIIGAGVAGLAAGMYAGRLNMRALVLGASSGSEKPIGGTITLTNSVENYPGFVKLSGGELAEKLKKHAEDYFVEIKEEKVAEVVKKGACFSVNGKYKGKTIIFATGTKWRKLKIKAAQEFENKGVHYCVLCDGPLMKDKIVAMIGGGDTAVKEGLFMTEFAKKVYIIVRGDKLRAEPINIQRLKKNEKIEVLFKTNVTEIKGGKLVDKVILDKPYKGQNELAVSGVFGAIGHIALSGLAKELGVEVNGRGEIKIDRDSTTNIPGVFAAGDVTDTSFKQAITGVGEGVTAAHSAYKYINENEFVCAGE